jgi:hypothetical protein
MRKQNNSQLKGSWTLTTGFKKGLNSIKHNQAAQKSLLEQLALWDVVKEAGIDTDTVKAFTFHPGFMTPMQKKIERRRGNPRPGDYRGYFSSGDFFNCVRLKTGELVSIPLTRKPTEAAERIDDDVQPGDSVCIPSRAPYRESRS